MAGQSHHRAIGKKEAVARGQAGGDGQLSRDLRQYKLAPLGSERLQLIDLGARQIIADEPVDHRLKLLRRKHRLGEVFQVKPISHGHRRAAHQLAKRRVGGRAPKRALRPALRAEHPHEDVGISKCDGPRLGASGDARFRPPRGPTLHEDVGIARPRAGGEVSASMRIGPLV